MIEFHLSPNFVFRWGITHRWAYTLGLDCGDHIGVKFNWKMAYIVHELLSKHTRVIETHKHPQYMH